MQCSKLCGVWDTLCALRLSECLLQIDQADIVCFNREINFKSLVTGSSKLWLYHFLWYIHSNPEDLNSQRPLSVAKVTFYSLFMYQTSLVNLRRATYFKRPADCLKLPLSWNWQEMCKNCTIMACKVIFNVKNWSNLFCFLFKLQEAPIS